jgi:dephospho-CoA kinase
MLRVGLTGGIATGKSHCLERFARLGAATIDADELARDAVAAGSPGLDAVISRFGRAVLQSDGQLDRTALGRVVFEDAGARRDLEAIIHPAVYQAINGWFRAIGDSSRAQSGPIIAVADIPLLFETNRQGDFDVVVVTACTPDRQLQRLMERGLSKDESERRIAAQIPIEEKTRRADHVIDTSGTFADTDIQIDQVWKALTARAAQRP